MAIPVQAFVDQLILRHQVVMIGGLAVIAHGYSRHTQDADIWLDPLSSSEEWVQVVAGVCENFPSTKIHRLPGWVEVSGGELIAAVEETGVVRKSGNSR